MTVEFVLISRLIGRSTMNVLKTILGDHGFMSVANCCGSRLQLRVKYYKTIVNNNNNNNLFLANDVMANAVS